MVRASGVTLQPPVQSRRRKQPAPPLGTAAPVASEALAAAAPSFELAALAAGAATDRSAVSTPAQNTPAQKWSRHLRSTSNICASRCAPNPPSIPLLLTPARGEPYLSGSAAVSDEPLTKHLRGQMAYYGGKRVSTNGRTASLRIARLRA